MDRVEDKFTKQKTGRGLQDFFEKDQEMDAYEEYRQSVDNHRDGNQSTMRMDPNELDPQMPRFDSFFESKSKGLHPFDSIANSFDERELNTQADVDAQTQEEALYKRELLGRMMGMKLTPRQFEVLTGQFRSQDTRSERVQAMGRQQFLDQRDSIRLMEEHMEKYRRGKVLSGEWPEEESKQRQQQWLAEMVEKAVTPSM